MIYSLSTTIGAIAVGAALQLGPTANSQEHVRLMLQLRTHDVHSLAFSPDGRFVLTGGWDNTVRLWEASTGNQLSSFEGHLDKVQSVAFSSDGTLALSGSYDHTARLWDVKEGKQLRQFISDGEIVESVAFSPDSHLILTGGSGGIARLWDAATGRQIRYFEGHATEIHAVAFSPDGLSVLTGSWDGTAILWDLAVARQVRRFSPERDASKIPQKPVLSAQQLTNAKIDNALLGRQAIPPLGNNNAITSVAFSPDGRLVLTGSEDHSARLWDRETAKQVRSFSGHSAGVASVTFSPDGSLVLTAGWDKTARLWDTSTGIQVRSLVGSSSLNCAVFSPQGDFVLTGASDGISQLWNTSTGSRAQTFSGHTPEAGAVSFSGNGGFILTSGPRLWDTDTGQQNWKLQRWESGGWVAGGSFSQDGRLMATTGDKARLWETLTGKYIRPLGDGKAFVSASLSADGSSLLTKEYGGLVRIWDTSQGQEIRSFASESNRSSNAALSPDGRSVFIQTYQVTKNVEGLVKFGSQGAKIWNVHSGEPICSVTASSQGSPGFYPVDPAVYSSDGRFLLGGLQHSAALWDTTSCKNLRVFDPDDGLVFSVAFSSDSRLVLTGSSHSAQLWDVSTGRKLSTFVGHLSRVTSVAISPNGRFVLTSGSDTTTRLWDAATGKELATLLTLTNGSWVVTDDVGRYDSSNPDDTPGLVWVTDTLRSIELRELKDNYYTPGLLASIMKGERLPDVKGLDLVPAPPEATIASEYRPESNQLLIKIADQGGGVGRLVASVNGRKVLVMEHPSAEQSTEGNLLTLDLSAATLMPGKNKLSVYAYDAGNQIRSHEAVSTFTLEAIAKGFKVNPNTAELAEDKPQFYAIVVGTGSFPGNHAMDLLYPAHDAQSMMAGLKIGAGKLFGEEYVHLRLLTTDAPEDKDQPKKENIVAAFAEVKRKARASDVLLVYFSGHGVSLHAEKDSYYYLTTDARSLEIENNPALRALSTVSAEELRQWLGAKEMPLKEALILDTCAAGAANEELLKLVEKRGVPPDQRRAIEILKESTGTIILMGSAADKVSYEASKYGEGLLTYALLNGMRGRSIEEGSRLNVSHWFQNASEDVLQLAQSIGGIQKPVIAAPSGTGFPVALLEPADQARIPLAAIKRELVHLSCHDEDDKDPLGLSGRIRERLREIGRLSALGREADPLVVYFDDMTDGPSDSLTPRIVYSARGNIVDLRLRIEQAGETLKEERLSLDSTDKDALASAVAAKLVELAGLVRIDSATE